MLPGPRIEHPTAAARLPVPTASTPHGNEPKNKDLVLRPGGPETRHAPVLQVGEDAGNERLQDLFLADAAQEAKRHAADVLVGVLQVVTQVLADQDLQGHTGICRQK